MARIPDDEIDRLKRETDLAALVRSRGIELAKHGGKDLIGRCPFHADTTTPNFIVSPDKGLFHCMACGAAGNPIQFVERFDGVSFRHAFEILAEGRGFNVSATAPQKFCTTQRLERSFEPTGDDTALMGQVVDYYHERLLKTPVALDYLKGRGLLNDEALEKFRLGFADRTLGLRLPDKNRKEGAAIRTRLQTLGIIRESGHEHFNGSVVLPVFTAAGEVGEMYGRKITAGLRPGTPLHLYLPGPHAGIWNAEALSEPEIILCEAPLDALTFWVNGFRNVTFIYGTQGFTDELFDAILSKKVRRVRVAYDADEAGNKAAARDIERLSAQGVECFRVKFPWGMDANEYAQKVQPAAKSLQTALNAAEWIGEKAERRPPVDSEPSPSAEPCPTPPDASRPPASASSSLSLAANQKAAEFLSAVSSGVALAKPEAPSSGEEAKAESAANEKEQPKHSTPDEPQLERVGEYHVLKLGRRTYRVGGLDKNNSLEVMKVSVRLLCEDRFHLDGFDLTRDGERRRFIERAAEETGLETELIKRDLGKLLLALEEAQQERLSAALEIGGPAKPDMTPEERAETLAFLKSPDLIDRIVGTFPACGLAGEARNLLGAYLACTSRKLDKPLAVIIQSTSAAGKSTLMEAVLSMFPEEERVKYSAMTGQSLYYLGATDLKHKILAIVEEEGAEKASYALKLLQSEGELTIASTGKDPHTGRMVTQEYRVEGPVMIFLTTTAVEIDEELLNRCLILTVDESREQTERIHALQRKARTLEGLRLKKQRRRLLTLMRNAQRLLEPVDVVNPYADALTFTTDRTRTRRDHEKYLTLIDSIALLHQYQRPRETDYDGERTDFIRVTLDDIELANRLAPELLGRSLDELPPQTRRLLGFVKDLVRTYRKEHAVEQSLALFSRRELRDRCGWSYSQVKRHLERLQELEFIAPRYGRMGATIRYELLVDADEPSELAHIGLIDVARLRERTATTNTWTGEKATLTPPCQNETARLAPTLPATCANLAALSVRESGALAGAVSPCHAVAIGEGG